MPHRHLERIRWLTTAAVCLLMVAPVSATDDVSSRTSEPRSTAGLTAPVVLDRDSYAELKDEQHIVLADVTLADGNLVTLELDAFDILAPDVTFVVADSTGEILADRPEVALFRGWIATEPASSVFLSLSPYGVYGKIERGDGTHVISSGPYGSGLPTVIYNLTTLPEDAIQWLPFTCGTELLADVEPEPLVETRDDGLRTPLCRRVRVAIETDSQFTGRLFAGSPSAASAYATALIGAVSEIYSRDFQIELEISYLRLWADGDDPWDQSSSGDQLSQFRDYWNENMGDIDRNIAHFLSGRSLGGGVAWVGVLCPSSYSYGLSGDLGGSFPYPLQDYNWSNWDPFVVAHEIGHNFSAPHTHDLSPPIDGCGLGDCSDAYGGTIMSYCHICSGGMSNIRLAFHDRMIIEEVLPYLDAVDHCLASAGPVILTQPEPLQTICQGELALLSVNTDSAFVSYQWRRGSTDLTDGPDYVGSTEATLVILDVSPEDAADDYNCIVTDTWTGCPAVSTNAEISVDSHAAVITEQPQDQSVAPGDVLRLTVGTESPTVFYAYQWRRDGTPLSDGGRVGGAATPELVVIDVTTADAGAYDCELTALLGAGCTVMSDAAQVTIGARIGDIDGDGDVDLSDLAELLGAYRHCAGEPEYNPAADFDASGCVDLSDLSALLASYGNP